MLMDDIYLGFFTPHQPVISCWIFWCWKCFDTGGTQLHPWNLYKKRYWKWLRHCRLGGLPQDKLLHVCPFFDQYHEPPTFKLLGMANICLEIHKKVYLLLFRGAKWLGKFYVSGWYTVLTAENCQRNEISKRIPTYPWSIPHESPNPQMKGIPS